METQGLTDEQLAKFRDDGFLLIPDFLSDDNVSSLKKSCRTLIDHMDPKEHTRTVIFSTTEHTQGRTDYFLNSGDKVRFFYEKDAMDEKGDLKVERHLALNKIGHSLHWHVPEFRKVSFSPKIKSLAKSLGFESPAIVQSMYIFKQPGFGGEVTPHKDCTFLSTNPQSCIGFWFALEDATLDNACLWFIPGSHKNPTKRRFIRNPDKNGPLTIFNQPPDPEDLSLYVPVPVKKGSLVLINGQVNHMSEKNKSMTESRHIYTFHIIERQKTEWDERNWLQPTSQLPFTGLYEN